MVQATELITQHNGTNLHYRLANAQDKQNLWELDQDPEVMRFINGGKPTTMQEMHQVWMPRIQQYTHPDKGWGLWLVFSQSSDAFLGWILLRPMGFFNANRDDMDMEIGWRFKAQHWGKGYATQAAADIMQHYQAHHPVSRFIAIADPENLASIQVMKKLDMQFIKTYLHQETISDTLEYNLTLALYTKTIANTL